MPDGVKPNLSNLLFVLISVIILIILLLLATTDFPEPVKKDPLIIEYYYSPSCHYCVQQNEVFENLTQKYSGQFIVVKHNIDNEISSFNEITSKYNGRGYIPFMVFSDNTTLEGYHEDNYVKIKAMIENR